MESGDDGLESEANVHPRPCLTGAGSPGAESTATDRGPSRQARLNRSAEGARTAYSARHTCPKTPETQSRNRSVWLSIGLGLFAAVAIALTIFGLRADALDAAGREQTDLAIVVGREISASNRAKIG